MLLSLVVPALASPQIQAPSATVPAEVEACREAGKLWLSDPDSFEQTELNTGQDWTRVWQIKDRFGDRIGHLLVYPDTCRVVVLVVTPSSAGAPMTQVIPPIGTFATSAEHRMLRRWAGVVAPTPSPCAQRSDQDGDGVVDYEQRYLYDDISGGLIAVLTDDEADGVIDHEVRFNVDPFGQPTSRSNGGSCDHQSWCSRAWTPQCPSGMTCTEGAYGLIETMTRGVQTTTNDFSCWTRGPDRWHFVP